MRETPDEQPYPEGMYSEITLHVTLDLDNGIYMLRCPEWMCEFPCGARPSVAAYKLLKEIETHNKEEARYAET